MKYYKSKDYYYITYTSQNFVTLNPRYKIGINIFILQYDGENFFVKETIESVNEKEYVDKKFFPVIRWCVFGWRKRDIIEQVFTKDWYGH